MVDLNVVYKKDTRILTEKKSTKYRYFRSFKPLTRYTGLGK